MFNNPEMCSRSGEACHITPFGEHPARIRSVTLGEESTCSTWRLGSSSLDPKIGVQITEVVNDRTYVNTKHRASWSVETDRPGCSSVLSRR